MRSKLLFFHFAFLIFNFAFLSRVVQAVQKL